MPISQVVVLIAFEEFDNLGVRYIASVLNEAEFETRIIDMRSGKEEILESISKMDPVLIGFSVIFQYKIELFQDIIRFLREKGIKCHFTAGGHYASIRHEELLHLIPELNSVVRFEGESTVLELARKLTGNSDWKNIEGIAYNSEGHIISNKLRLVEKDLDTLPYPFRSDLRNYTLEKKFTTLIAGRGCVHDCAFCNLKEFFILSGGPRKRHRSPEMVVKEIEFLHHQKECSVFLFEDDDFPVQGGKNNEWILKFCNELADKELAEQIMWKINCRPDEITEDIFSLLKNHGLFKVFLGIDDGTDSGLKWLNKHMTAEKSIEGIKILKSLSIEFDYGFMLFQPLTTFSSFYKNLEFLWQICSDGYTPVTFLKLMPFYDTRIEKELISEGRIKGIPGYFDYDFQEPAMNHYFNFIMEIFSDWLFASDGIANMSKWAKINYSVYQKYFEPKPQLNEISESIKKVIMNSNLFILETMKDTAQAFEKAENNNASGDFFETYNQSVLEKHELLKEEINNSMKILLSFVYKPKPLSLREIFK